jgi:hypothetical protein
MWVLIVVFTLNGVQQTAELKPFGEWMCNVMSHRIPTKQITVDGSVFTVISARCEKRDK